MWEESHLDHVGNSTVILLSPTPTTYPSKTPPSTEPSLESVGKLGIQLRSRGGGDKRDGSQRKATGLEAEINKSHPPEWPGPLSASAGTRYPMLLAAGLLT